MRVLSATLSLLVVVGLAGCDASHSVPAATASLRGAVPDAAPVGGPAAAAPAARQEGEVEGRVRVDIHLPDGGGLFSSRARFEIEAEDGEIKAVFRGRDFLNGDPIDRYAIDVTCVAFEPDGRSARIGGVFTATEAYPDFVGAGAVLTVVDNGDGTDAGAGPFFASPESVAFHCETGFERAQLLEIVNSIGTCETESGLCAVTRGDIEVESESDDD